MDKGSTCEEQSPALYLKVANRQQLRQFLKAIHPEFLRVVYPRESGLLDWMYAARLLTDTDQESMSGKDVPTRKQQARKLWILLNNMSVHDFVSCVFPVLLKQFRHIIPDEFLTTEVVDTIHTDDADHAYCLRHEIMSKIRVISMADLLLQHDHLGFNDYEDIASGPVEADTVWTKMFQACRDGDQNSSPQLLRGLHNLLQKYKVAVPEHLQDRLSCGIPCTCSLANSPALPALSSNPLRKASSWVKKSPFGCTTPQSTPRSSRRSGAPSDLDDDFQVLGSGTSLNPGSISSSSAPQDDLSDLTGLENMSTVEEEEEEENLSRGLAPVTAPLLHEMKNTAENTRLLKKTMRQSFATDFSYHSLPVSSDKEGDEDLASLEFSDEMSCGKMEASEFAETPAFAESVYIPIPEAATSSATPIRGQLAAGIKAECHSAGVRPEIYNFVVEVIQAAILYWRNRIFENRCVCLVALSFFFITACLYITYSVYAYYRTYSVYAYHRYFL